MIKKRDFSVDALRSLGIISIIIAHINPPAAIFQIRNFDVPFMVILSGYLFSKSTSHARIGIEYIWKRFKRLAVPVWVFLIFIFTGGGILEQYPFSIKHILGSFLLWSGIGYVWIIRIYLVVAIFGPWAVKKIKGNIKYLVVGFIISEILVLLSLKFLPSNFLLNGILINIPYILFFTYGAMFTELEEKKLKIINILMLVALMLGTSYLYFIKDEYLKLQDFKYPPRSYYVFYAILISNILLKNKNKLMILEKGFIGKIVSFIGNSTMWIYLWHIPPVMVIQLLNKKGIAVQYIPAFIIVFTVAVVATYVQQRIIKFVCGKFLTNNTDFAKNLKIVFLG